MMTSFIARLVIVLTMCLCLLVTVSAKVEVTDTFPDPDMASLYDEMIRELRCLVCQNQNLLDSNAELAQDLRRKTRELVLEGKSRSEIADFMVSRYGEFVLYRPRLTIQTAFLWISPIILFILLFVFILRWRRTAPRANHYSDTELKQARSLIQDEGDIK